MLVALTGATGHVGANLVRLLVERGHRVRCLVRRDVRALEGLDVERVAGDTRESATLPPLVDGAEVVFHLAAVISIAGDPRGEVAAVNVGGSRNVAAAARAAGVRRFVHCSSVHAFDAPPGRPFDETAPRATDPRAPAYDRSKAMGEVVVREALASGPELVVAHPTSVLGQLDFKGSRMGRTLLALRDRSLPALVPGGFDWVDACDVSLGLLAAAERGRPGSNYLLGGHRTTVRELARLASTVTGIAPPRLTVPSGLARAVAPVALAWSRLAHADPLFTPEGLRALATDPIVDCSRAVRDLGWSPRPLVDTLRDTYAWHAAAGHA